MTRNNRRPSPRPSSVTLEESVTVTGLGRDGDGIAPGPDGSVYIPFALPGEAVTVERQDGEKSARLREVVTPSPERVAPPCRLFGACGGCSLQHQARDATLAWKAARVEAALRQAGFASPAPRLHQTGPNTRRRMDLAVAARWST